MSKVLNYSRAWLSRETISGEVFWMLMGSGFTLIFLLSVPIWVGWYPALRHAIDGLASLILSCCFLLLCLLLMFGLLYGLTWLRRALRDLREF